jgi:fatty acid desaturase
MVASGLAIIILTFLIFLTFFWEIYVLHHAWRTILHALLIYGIGYVLSVWIFIIGKRQCEQWKAKTAFSKIYTETSAKIQESGHGVSQSSENESGHQS